MMPAATDHSDVHIHGAYALRRVAADHWRLVGPDDRFPKAWVAEVIGPGDWVTEWSGRDTLTVDITRN